MLYINYYENLLLLSRNAKMEIMSVFITVDPVRDTVEQVRDCFNGM
jgi:cytochrome oxidase Cu insertion factor (SCO1/SenC/PrrC family)